MTNLELLAFSGENPVPLLDPYYNKDKVVITPTREEKNDLMRANARLIELITVFNYLNGEGRKEDDEEVQSVVGKVIDILDRVSGINFSAFSQFFMVYNSSYNSYSEYDSARKRMFVHEMLRRYCAERHVMYSSHGYSDAILQVMCDNYSHKRNSKTTIEKIVDVVTDRGICPFGAGMSLLESDGYFLLPDKGDRAVYDDFVLGLSLETKALRQEQGKLPDFVLKIGGHCIVGEAKMMKGSGGGQDKQLVEIINFIRYQERNTRVHYMVYLDGEYANMLLSDVARSPKLERQYQDIVNCLTDNPQNYFVNPAGFVRFLDCVRGNGRRRETHGGDADCG